MFYYDYKVIVDGMAISDYQVYPRKGAVVYIDGIELTKTSISNQSDINSSDIYIIAQIFAGIHGLRVEHSEYEVYVEQIGIYEYYPNDYYINNLVLKENTVRTDIDYNDYEEVMSYLKPWQNLMKTLCLRLGTALQNPHISLSRQNNYLRISS